MRAPDARILGEGGAELAAGAVVFPRVAVGAADEDVGLRDGPGPPRSAKRRSAASGFFSQRYSVASRKRGSGSLGRGGARLVQLVRSAPAELSGGRERPGQQAARLGVPRSLRGQRRQDLRRPAAASPSAAQAPARASASDLSARKSEALCERLPSLRPAGRASSSVARQQPALEERLAVVALGRRRGRPACRLALRGGRSPARGGPRGSGRRAGRAETRRQPSRSSRRQRRRSSFQAAREGHAGPPLDTRRARA